MPKSSNSATAKAVGAPERKIRVSPAMIRAGLKQFYRYEYECPDAKVVLRDIFCAMLLARDGQSYEGTEYDVSRR